MSPSLAYSPALPALEKLTQEDGEFQASLSYTVRSCLLETEKARRGVREIQDEGVSELNSK